MSYLIKNDRVIAETSLTLKSGEEVRYSNTLTKDKINANREFSLVNADYAKISNAKKWRKDEIYDHAALINDGEFHVSTGL